MTTMNKERQVKAADELESYEPVLKEIVTMLRTGVSDRLAYALLYRLRRDVGYIVRDLGEGVPTPSHIRQADEVVDSQKLPPKKLWTT